MPDLTNLEPTRSVVVPLYGEDATVHYSPGRMTLGQLQSIMAIDDGDVAAGLDVTVDLLARVITGWDITVNGGTALPVSREAINDVLPIEFNVRLFTAIADDFKGGNGNRASRRRRR